METFGETKRRRAEDYKANIPKRKRRNGDDIVEYLK